MHIHILGIGGTFMAGVAVLARALGMRVTGSDANVYPPMSTQLEAHAIELRSGYRAAHLEPAPDLVVVGNALSRGNEAVEAMLDRRLDYTSGPQWLAQHVLRGRRVVAVAGTHGKTTTASVLAWILESAGLAPGFLIGGVPGNFGVSARLGGELFVIEADEYDTAFFDKRSKFVHYRPDVAVLTNLEFDHADIFAGVDDIIRQFHHLVRTVPGGGRLLVNARDAHLERVLQMGCWSPVERFAAGDDADASVAWSAHATATAENAFDVRHAGRSAGHVEWRAPGRHNMANALAAVAAAAHLGVDPARACAALAAFEPAARRLECRLDANDIRLYDDFAHHPTAIRETLRALRRLVGGARLIAVFEPRSNTMRLGAHAHELGPAFDDADLAFVYRPLGLDWDIEAAAARSRAEVRLVGDVGELVAALAAELVPGDRVVVMSNGDFEGLVPRLIERLGAGTRPAPAAARGEARAARRHRGPLL